MKRTTTATPLVTATDSEALRANETADNNDNTSKEETMAKDEAATTPTSPGQSTLAAIAKEHHDSKESNMGKNTAPTLSTTTERDPDSRNTDRTVATTSPTTTEPRPDNSKEANAETDVLKKLLIPQDFARRVGTRKLVMTIPMRNPKKQEFVRVRQMVKPMLFYTLVDEQQTYVVTSDIADSFPGHIVMKELVLAITRQGTLILWPLRVPGENGRTDTWLTSAREAAVRAVHSWVRVQANMDLGAFEVYEAVGAIPDPEWPSLSMDEAVRIGVKGRVIDSLDHPVLQKLRGEI
jgi:hypothetical protein